MQAFDGNVKTKWLAFFNEETGCDARLEYWLQPGVPPAAVLRYVLTSGNDNPQRDPRDWTLEGLPPGVEADDAGVPGHIMRV